MNETFTYDNVGQLKSDGVISQYDYSPSGKLTAAAGAGVAASYTYDASGERFSKTVNGITTYSLRSAQGQTLSEYLGSCGATTWSRDLIYAGGQLIGAAKAVMTQPTVTLTASSASVSEAASTVTLTVQLTTPTGAALGCPVVVSYATSAGSATAGADYTQKSGILTFTAGAANGSTQSFTIPISGDVLDEVDETFSVGLSSATGATVGAAANAAVTIVDDDLPLISFALAASSVAENGGPVSVAVKLSTAVPLPSAASVTVSTSNGSALSSSDYGSVSQVVTFPTGSVSGATQSISIPIVNDGYHEPAATETFSVVFSSPSAAVIGSPSVHTVTIVEDDPVPAPVVVLDMPADGTIQASNVAIGGWAIDAHATTGTGITEIHVYAYPNADESQPGVFLGVGPYGSWRSDVATSYGSPFGASGYALTGTLPGPGVYRIKAAAYDPLIGSWVWSNGRNITVEPTPRMGINTPADGTVASTFTIQGWAIDAGAGSGTGVTLIHVYTYPNPGSGQAPIFLGTATYGLNRPDVAAAFGAQFAPSGYSLSTSLNAGSHQVVVYAYSSVTNSWSQAMSRYVTVAAGIYASIDAPLENATVGQPFGVTGWAVDASAPSGNGVPFMHAYVYLNGSTPQFLGAPNTIAGSHPDIGAWLQAARFNDSGWGITVSGVPAGTHLLVIYPYSSVTNSFGTALVRWITVQ